MLMLGIDGRLCLAVLIAAQHKQQFNLLRPAIFLMTYLTNFTITKYG